jgi:ATP-dependent protease ClpP protease subunit
MLPSQQNTISQLSSSLFADLNVIQPQQQQPSKPQPILQQATLPHVNQLELQVKPYGEAVDLYKYYCLLSTVKNTIYYTGILTPPTVHAILQELNACERALENEPSTMFGPKTITLTLNMGYNFSMGQSSLLLSEHIKLMKTPVHIVIANQLNMCGIVAVLGAKKRSIMKHSIAQFAPLVIGKKVDESHIPYSKEDAEQNELKEIERIRSYIISHTKITRPELLELERARRLLTAEECVKCGIADEILTAY